MGTLNEQGDQFIESEQPADNGYGQNGYQGPSSDLPGQRTTSGFLSELTIAKDFRNEGDWQTRKVSNAQLSTAYGMHPPKSGETIPAANTRRPVKR